MTEKRADRMRVAPATETRPAENGADRRRTPVDPRPAEGAARVGAELERHRRAFEGLRPLAADAVRRGDDPAFFAVCLKTVEIAEKIRGFEAQLNGGVHPDAHLDLRTRLKKQCAEAWTAEHRGR